MLNWSSINYRNIVNIVILSVAITACSSKKYSNWSECFSQEIKTSGDYRLSLFYCNYNYKKNNEENVELSAVGLNGSTETVNVIMPNGQIINNVPKGITKTELLRVLESNGYNTKVLLKQKDPSVTINSDGSLNYNK